MTTNDTTKESLRDELSSSGFEIGGDDQLSSLRVRCGEEPQDDEQRRRQDKEWQDGIVKLQIHTGTLLKTDAVSFLLGAGASKECGGVLIGRIPLEVERLLLAKGAAGDHLEAWVKCFYLAVARLHGAMGGVPVGEAEIFARRAQVDQPGASELAVNYESLLSLLYRWRAALPKEGGTIRLDGTPEVTVPGADLDACIQHATASLAERCRLPTAGAGSDAFLAYAHLLRKVLTRPLNLKRTNFFTLNYDTLLEQAADAEGVVLMDGFMGTLQRVFRPESFDQDLYFPAETTEGRVHRLDRVAHLYKLHGSITWRSVEADWKNPLGVIADRSGPSGAGPVLIYPTPAKFGETLGMPYAELFRRFAAALIRPQSTLFVLGYGFGDDHVNAIIRQALAVPSFTLVIVDPNPTSTFVQQLKSCKDRRVWILSGPGLGTFGGFVRRVLPDLRDEEVRRKVMATWRAVRTAGGDEGAEGVPDVE